MRQTLGARPRLGADKEPQLKPFIDALTRCLQPTDNFPAYLDFLVEQVDNQVEMVASLNYDTVFEDACKRRGISIDFGLTQWNERKIVNFHGKSIKFAKLHGSINWYEMGDDILIARPEQEHLKRALIFGAQSEKLVADGPYLQLRGEFQRALRRTNKVGIIGYSFQDQHINSLLRVWLSTRRNAKLVILDPSGPELGLTNLGPPMNANLNSKGRRTVDVVHVRGTAERKIRSFFQEVQSDPVSYGNGVHSSGLRVVD